MRTLPRRLILRRALQLAAAATVAPRLVPPATAADACVDPASESLRTSLNYVVVSADPARTCLGCGFFTADAQSPACGGCQILSGPVDAGGFCDSWSEAS